MANNVYTSTLILHDLMKTPLYEKLHIIIFAIHKQFEKNEKFPCDSMELNTNNDLNDMFEESKDDTPTNTSIYIF
jgi:hypothetical protein